MPSQPIPFLIALMLSLAAAGSSMAGEDPATARALSLIQEAQRAQGKIAGLGPILELEPVLAEIGAEDTAVALELLGKARLHPLARARAEALRARALLSRGERPKALEVVGKQGFALRWTLIGPFANDAMSGMEEIYAPEQGVELEQAVEGRHGAVAWRPLGPRVDLEVIDVEAIIRPIEGSVAYAACVVRSPKAQKAALRLGASAAYRLWLNGGLVGGVADEIGGGFDRDAYGIFLNKGDNLVLLKLGNGSGPMTFSLRVTDAEGAPLPGVEITDEAEALAGAASGLSFGAAEAPGRFEVTPALEAMVEAAEALPDSQRALGLARAALLAHHLRPDDPQEPHVDLMRRARQVAASPGVLLIHSHTAASQWERHDAIESALAQASRDPWLQYRLAQIAYRSVGDAEYARTWALLKRLAEAHPDFTAPQAMRATMMLEEGQGHAAMAAADALARRRPDHPAALKAAWSAAQELRDGARQIELCGQLHKVVADDIGLVGPCSSLLLKAGRADDALAAVEAASALRPDVTGFEGLLADTLHAAGRPAEAAEVLERLTALVPGESSYWRRLGVARERLGDRAGTLEALNRALAFDGQDPTLKSYVAHMEPREPSIEERWALPLPTPDPERDGSLFANDDLLTLIEQKVVRVFSNGLSSTFVQRATTIRTDVGLAQARNFQIAYTPSEERVEVIRARVTRPDGVVLESYQTFEQSLSEPWYNLYYDYKALVLVFPDLQVGDTVEVQYRLSATASQNILGPYFGDLWYAQDTSPRLAARYVLLSPPGRAIQARQPKLPHTMKEELLKEGDESILARSWTFSQVPKIAREEDQPGLSELADYLHLSTYASWDQIATWYWSLVKDQLVIDAEIERVVAGLVAGEPDKRRRVARILDYVLKNTRYVGLEFGIHGYKPYRTTLCLKRRFGDCKDKASLIKVMLNAAGIDANLVLVRTRNNGAIDTSPASLQIFDHAIAYVPEFDLFLDGTAEYSGTNELPWGDQGVSVLIVKDGGGHEFRTTPIAPASANALLSTLEVDLTGPASRIDASTTITGSFAAGYRRTYGTPEKREELLAAEVSRNFVGAHLAHHQFSELGDLEMPVRIAYRAEGGHVATREGGTLRFLPTLREGNLSRRLTPWPERRQPLDLGHPFTTQETFSIRLPPGAVLKGAPGDTSIKSPFGAFTLQVEAREGGPVEVRATLQIDAHRVEAADYAALRAWLGDVDRVLSTPIVADMP